MRNGSMLLIRQNQRRNERDTMAQGSDSNILSSRLDHVRKLCKITGLEVENFRVFCQPKIIDFDDYVHTVTGPRSLTRLGSHI